MTDPQPTASATRKPDRDNASSRRLAMFAVLVLIVIAVGGILLAGRQPAPAAPVAASAPAPVVAAAPASAPASAASEPMREPPHEVVFPSGSDRVPPSAAAIVAHWAEQARLNDKKLRISARFLTGANKQRDMDLAKARTSALHHAAMSNGLTGDKLQTELVEVPEGSLAPGEGERIVFSLI